MKISLKVFLLTFFLALMLFEIMYLFDKQLGSFLGELLAKLVNFIL